MSARRLRAARALVPALGLLLVLAPATRAASFPPGENAFHTYAEMSAEVKAVADANPSIVRRFSIGTSYQGRQLWAVKISDRVAIDENEPEVMFDGLHHAREHMGAEMVIAILHRLVDGYGTDARATRLVNTREIFLVFMVNPDGGEYDITGGEYQMWRKNRQPTPGSSAIGTDLNRNYAWQWGYTGGSDSLPSSNIYRGPSAFSAPETRAMRDFVADRVVNGRQQIRALITFHTAGRLVMWPYGYTYTDVPYDMTREDHAAFVALGRYMASTNGYKPEQASDLYLTSGTFRDWAYGRYRIFAFTFELSPPGWYEPDETIPSETGRNMAAVLHLIATADCPYRASGRAIADCGPLYDDLEIDRGWRVDPFATDTATSGRWQRARPQATTQDGPKQVGRAASGSRALVTGAMAGSSAGSYDVDGGTTSVRSAPVTLDHGTRFTLSFRYSFAHSARATSVDGLRVLVVGPSATTTVFRLAGAPVDRDGGWKTARVDVSRFAGQTVRLLIQATDAGTASLVEAAIDDVRVTRE